MRITLSLDEDVARLLNEESRGASGSFDEVVNHFLRLVLTRSPRERFMVNPRSLGLPPGLTYDSAEQLLDAVESPEHQ